MNIVKKILIMPIHFYQKFISPYYPARCRFYPSCSSYAIQAIELHGPWKGLYLAVKRILRCHPGNPGGFDPVPPRKSDKNSDHSTALRVNFQEDHG